MYYNADGEEMFYDKQEDNYKQDHYQLIFNHQMNSSWRANLTFHYTHGRGYYEEYSEDQNLSDYLINENSGQAISDLIRRKCKSYIHTHTTCGTAPSLVEMINTPPSPIPKAITGIRRMVGGSVETIMTPGMSADAIPRYVIANPLGPYSLTCGTTGYNCNVLTGAYNVNAVAGFVYMQASTAVTILAGAGMLLEAGAAVLILGKTVFIN